MVRLVVAFASACQKKPRFISASKKDSGKVVAGTGTFILQSEGVYAVGRTAVRNIPLKSRAGKRVANIAEERGKGRGSAGGINQRPTKANSVKSVQKNFGGAATAVNRQRVIAEKLGCQMVLYTAPRRGSISRRSKGSKCLGHWGGC